MLLEQTETELIEACRRGERDALCELFDRYKDRVYTIALRYSGNASAAEDIAQDTFLKLFARLPGFQGNAAFASWLYRVVVNSFFDYKRSLRRWLPLAGSFARQPAALDDAIRAQMNGQLSEALGTLPPEQRMTVVLRYSQEMGYDEIAEVMQCSSGTVASRLNRAHRSLEKTLRRAHAGQS